MKIFERFIDLLLLVMLGAMALAYSEPARADEWTGQREHITFSAVAGVGAAYIMPKASPLTQWSVAMLPGIAKELTDYRASKKDLLCDAFGAALGVGLGRWSVSLTRKDDRWGLVTWKEF